MASVNSVCRKSQAKIKEVCKGLFIEGKMKVHDAKIPIREITNLLHRKLLAEGLQGVFLIERTKIFRYDTQEVYEKTFELYEKLFRKKKLYVYAYICCLMIILKQRARLGLENVELRWIKKAIKRYPAVSKRNVRAEFKVFLPIFKRVLEEAGKIALPTYIFVKMQMYLSAYHKFHGSPELAIEQKIIYINYRLEYGMYSRPEEIIAELQLTTIECIEANFLNQAVHLLNGIRTLMNRLSDTNRFQKVVLLEFNLLISALIVAKNIETVRGFQNYNLSAADRRKFIPTDQLVALKMDLEDTVRLTLAPKDATDLDVDRLKAKLLSYAKFFVEPLIADLSIVYGDLMNYFSKTENFANLEHIEVDCF